MFLSNGTFKTPVSLTSSSWFPSMPPMSSHGWPSAYAGIYSRQLWVYVVVSKLAKATARLPLPVYQRGELDRKRVNDHPMARLLSRPNPGLSAYDLWLWTSSTKDIYGDTFWYKQRRGGVVVALYPLHPASMTYRPEHGNWKFDNGSLVLDNIADSDLVHFRSFHPESTTRGLSPLEPLRATLENEWHARNATSSFWENGARPGTALVHPSTLSQPAADRLKAQYDGLGKGSGNTGRTIVLEEGMKPETLTLTAEEAQYVETRKLNREEVCAGYDVPPPVVHILDHATFSNITEQMRSMYRDTMGGRLPGFEAAVEVDLRQAEWPDDDVYAEFLMDDVLRGDFEARQDALQKASHMTIAEKRKVENLPFIEGTDRIFLNTATLPLDAIDAQVAALAPAPAPPVNDEPPAVPLSVVRSVTGRLSWQKTLDDVEAGSLTADLAEADAASIVAALEAEKATLGSVSGLRDRLRGMAVRETTLVTIKAPDLTAYEQQVAVMLADFFRGQGAAVLESGSFDAERWDAELTGNLHTLAVAVSSSIGKATMRSLSYDPATYDVARTVDFLRSVAERLAVNINATTRAQYEEADEPASVFATAEESRAAGIATGTVTMVAGFAVIEAGKRLGEAEDKTPTKKWITGRNPRSSHARMNGQTVGIDSKFSNGMKWPGESGDVDDVAGCNCSVEVSF